MSDRILVIYIKDEVWTYFGGLTDYQVKLLDDKLSVFIPGYRFNLKFKLKQWDGKKHLFDEKRIRTFTRLLPKCLELLLPMFDDVEIVDERPKFLHPAANATENLFAEYNWTMRPYQVEAVNDLVSAGTGLCLAGTGAGKTSICAALSKIYGDAGYRSIVIVPSVDLINQTYETYTQLGLDTGRYGGKYGELSHWHVISTWQSLQNCPEIVRDDPFNHVAESGQVETIRGFSCAILDECHFGFAGNSIQTILNNFGENIPFRFGMTGTLPKEPLEQEILHATLGEVQCSIRAADLIAAGYLSTVEITPVQLKIGGVDLPDYPAEKAYLAKHEPSLDWCEEFVRNTVNLYGNTLVLVGSVPFGKRLAKRFSKDKVIFIAGDVDTDTRKEHYDKLENENDVLVIASFGVASTGLSIDRIFAGVLMHAPKSFTKSIQAIGRYLRKRGDKSHADIFDVHTSLKYSRKHFRERKKYYDEACYPVAKEVVHKIQ